MAKVTSPLLSLSATGAFGKKIIFQKTAAGHTAKQWAEPSGQPSAAQLARRITYQDACAAWQALTSEEKSIWDLTGAARKITGFNAFLSDALQAAPPPPPPEQDPYYANVVALLHFDGADQSTDFIDQTARVWTPHGNAKIILDAAMSGGACGYLDGAGDFIDTPYLTADFDWWTQDFTIECFLNPVSFANAASGLPPTLIGNNDPYADSSYWSFGTTTNGNPTFFYWSGAPHNVTHATALNIAERKHIAMTKTAAGVTVFAHGIAGAPTAIIGQPLSSQAFLLTLGQYNTICFNTKIDELRITKGVARYAGNFTPPAAPFPNN